MRNWSRSANEASNWKHWLAFCAHMNTSPWRDDAAANSGGDQLGHERETELLALGLLFIYARMKPAKRTPTQPPKPASALAVLRGVRRIHKRMGYKMVDLGLAVRLASALANEYALEHGPELLQPQRTEPLTNAMVEALVLAPDGPLVGGGEVVHVPPVPLPLPLKPPTSKLNVSFVMLWLNKNAWSDVHVLVRMGVVGTTASANRSTNRRFG